MRVGPSWWYYCFYNKRHQGACSLSSCIYKKKSHMSICAHCETPACCKPREKNSHNETWTPDLGLPASETVSNHFCCLCHPVYGILSAQVKTIPFIQNCLQDKQIHLARKQISDCLGRRGQQEGYRREVTKGHEGTLGVLNDKNSFTCMHQNISGCKYVQFTLVIMPQQRC